MDKPGGWQDTKQKSRATSLFVFTCGKPTARAVHEIHISRTSLDCKQPNEQQIQAGPLCKRSQLMIVEADQDLACSDQWTKERIVRTQRVQKRDDGYRYTVSVDTTHVMTVTTKLHEQKRPHANLDVQSEAFALIYVPQGCFHPLAQKLIEASAPGCLGIHREAPQWMMLQGSAAGVEHAISVANDFLRFAGMIGASGRSFATHGDTTFLKTFRPVSTEGVFLISEVAPWISEDVVASFLVSLNIKPLKMQVRRNGDGPRVTLCVGSDDA